MIRSKVWAFATLLALIAVPILLCSVPPQLAAQENDCCKQMASQCGHERMPSSSSCCETHNDESRPYLSANHVQLAAPIVIATPSLFSIDSVISAMPQTVLTKEAESP